LLWLVVSIRAVLRSDLGEATRERGRWLDAMGVTVLTLVYVAAMHGRLFGFAILTTVFLILTIGLLTRFQVRTLPWVVGIAAATGFGCQYLFTRVFIVDLPGL
ncbi:MAG: tripartite tricarboxylate transporter TctB family protein, partial [Geminicoccaceae bacterium]